MWLCLSFVLLLAFGLGEGELGVVIGRLSAVRMDYRVAQIHKALSGGGGGCMGALDLSPNETSPRLQLDRQNNITPHARLGESIEVVHHMGQFEKWTSEFRGVLTFILNSALRWRNYKMNCSKISRLFCSVLHIIYRKDKASTLWERLLRDFEVFILILHAGELIWV